MNAETGNEPGTEPESPKRRGRIPQSAWPQILERYRAGATLSAIAREFECTPSAISYIVRKAEASGALTPGEAEAGDTGADDTREAAPDAAPQNAAPQVAAPQAAATAAEAPEASAPAPSVERPQRVAPARAAAPAAPTAPAAEASAPAPVAPPVKTRLELPRQPVEPRVTEQPAPPPPAPPTPPTAEAGKPGARPEPTPPVDAVEARLRETARGCLAAYRGWRQQPSESSIQSLAETVHELRKALARIEIDMSASRRDEQVARPIPIPAHRAARRGP